MSLAWASSPVRPALGNHLPLDGTPPESLLTYNSQVDIDCKSGQPPLSRTSQEQVSSRSFPAVSSWHIP